MLKALAILAVLGGLTACAGTHGPHPSLTAPRLLRWALGERCGGSLYAPAARYNAAAQTNLIVAPFGRAETGWAAYAPLVAATIGARCAPEEPGFAGVLARWQAAHGLTPHGALTAETLQTLKGLWQARRPFVMMRLKGVCPAPPDEAGLTRLPPGLSYGGKTVLLRPGAARALQRMVADARRAWPEIAADPALLTAFSGYRSPAYDAARCAAEHNCQGLVRAECSAHRTGLAVDLDVGAAQGFAIDASADPNRLAQTKGPAYRWLIRHAARYGFVNYAFEPWHWEWTGAGP
jgi:hypothetical protein